MSGWETTKGGSSDTVIWAQRGIESFNLSAGYMNEHTSQESLDIEACNNTAKLVTGVFKNTTALKQVLRDIKSEHRGRTIMKKAL